MHPTYRPDPAAQLHELARDIAERDLPAFGLSLRQLLEATASDSSSGQQVAEIVLRDPGLTSRVLRAANAAYLGLVGDARVVTVTRAVVVLGLNPIRSLCVSALAVESLGSGEHLASRVHQTLARALHAAVQARDIGHQLQASKATSEQWFVEAMLGHLGELAFWCFGGEQAQRLDEALRAGQDGEQAQQRILGGSLASFGRALLHAWKLDSVLRDSPEVLLAMRLSEQLGSAPHPAAAWTQPQVRQTVRQIADLLGRDATQTLDRLRDNALQALQLARALGAPEAAAAIPADAEPSPPAAPEAPPADPAWAPDPQQQLRMLGEMGQAARTRKELPLLLETCLEGLHRSVGLDRCALCLLNPPRNRLVARMAIGVETAALRQDLQWDWHAQWQTRLPPDTARWCKAASSEDRWLLDASGAAQGFVAAFTVDEQFLGCFYADCLPSGRQLAAGQFEAFQRFVWMTHLIVRALPRGS